ncbi:uncharacterized protein BXZ73DRAFT_92935 [Epithele typhae]|uniref:uncharacterized protein n=1 Tax=Epithele typhae TaxID=378194 RepID=UPI002007EDB6|nr:uncharacterized protein BXZ73DRAFT_92935 [Epithele typhae]KAH9913704.1 hypothetical protein BXZ73DRAFT_92935 [Epithele typhae]
MMLALPCNKYGHFLPPNTPPTPLNDNITWEPFDDRATFEFVEWVVEDSPQSHANLKKLLRILAAKFTTDGMPDYCPFYRSKQQILDAIDAIECGEALWRTVAVRYRGPLGPHSPPILHIRNSLEVVKTLVGNPEFVNHFDYVPFKEYTAPDCRQVSNMMSGQWSFDKADEISIDPSTQGGMLVPIVLGADKTTVSVATGHQEFYPTYMSIGNIHNSMRRSHRESVIPVAFLPIPHTSREFEDDEDFRVFKKQVYHSSLTALLMPLRPGMTKPHVLRCPDLHFRRAIFQAGPFIADYLEQVYVSGVVYMWCGQCLSIPKDDFLEGDRRTHELTAMIRELCTPKDAWVIFGINPDVEPFTTHFPRADIHELLTPDILHQLVKGVFKDHLVEWVLDYIKIVHGERVGNKIIDDIDRRISAVAPFPGLRRFPQGRKFKQWTGDDSKALMKVFLPAIAGHVPVDVVQCVKTFLDFCYIARRPSHDSNSIHAMEELLVRFHDLRTVFKDAGVRDDFELPRQHALVHFPRMIRQFGSPNGVCSTITESKHIPAVKKPWRESNRRNPLEQILLKLVRKSKLASARVNYGRHGMINGDVLSDALRNLDLEDAASDDSDVEDVLDPEQLEDALFRELAAQAAAGDVPQAEVTLSAWPAYKKRAHVVAQILQQPRLVEMLRRFLYAQLNLDNPDAENHANVDLLQCPFLHARTLLSVYHSATAVFYAPSDVANPGGMTREMIRSTPRWWKGHARYDTVLVNLGGDAVHAETIDGMMVARVHAFVSVPYDGNTYECAIVRWYVREEQIDLATGMWIVHPELENGHPVYDVIPVASIVRACHLISVYGRTRVPDTFHFSDSLDAFNRYYLNMYVDYHLHELLY